MGAGQMKAKTLSPAPPALIQALKEELVKAASQEDGAIIDAILQAEEILKNGNPLEYLLDGFRLNHQGHEEVSRSIIYAMVLQSSETTKGLQPSISGAKGGGKSHGARSTLHLQPPEYLWDSSLSTKSLYYHKPREKCTIYIDESLPDPIVDIIKRVQTNFQTVTTHKTIVDKKPVTLEINKRMVFINTSVFQGGDDQLKDRALAVGIMNEKADYDAYYKFEMPRRKEGRPEFLVNDQVLVCREIMLHIKLREFNVKLPDIDFAYKHDTRLMNQVFDLMEGSAILNYMQREHVDLDGVIHVLATEADLQAALNFGMFTIADKDSEGRLSRSERALDEKIQKYIDTKKVDAVELTESEIADIYGKTQQAVRKLLYGANGNQHTWNGGLLENAPWYKMDRQQMEDYHGIKHRTGQSVIKVQKHVYQVQSGSFAWVLNEPSEPLLN
jgi:hypothetical protein